MKVPFAMSSCLLFLFYFWLISHLYLVSMSQVPSDEYFSVHIAQMHRYCSLYVKDRQVFDVGVCIQNSSRQLFEEREFISSSNPISPAVGFLGFSETISLFFIVTLKMGRQWWGPSLRFHKCCCFMSFNTSSKESTSNNFLSQLFLCVWISKFWRSFLSVLGFLPRFLDPENSTSLKYFSESSHRWIENVLPNHYFQDYEGVTIFIMQRYFS